MAIGTAAAIAAGAAAVTGSIVGGVKAGKDRKAAQQAAADAMNEIESVGAPPDQSAQILYKHFQAAGILTPELEGQIQQGFSKLAQAQEDPKFKDAQTRALETLQQKSRTGLDASDRLSLNQVRQENQRDLEAKRQQIIQNMQSRGLGGSGAELVAQLQASQAGADSQSEAGDRIAAQASQNALQALQSSGNLAGSIRGQDWQEEQAKDNAADEMNRFNINNSINQQQRNTDRENSAQAANLSNSQAISNSNTQMDNNELLRQRDAVRQNYLDRMNTAQSLSNAKLGQASQLRNDASQTAQNWQKIGQGTGSAITTLGSAYINGQKAPASKNITFNDDEV